MITLFGMPQSRSFRVLWALEEANIDYEYQVVNLGQTSQNGTQTEKYKTMNFQGKVPCLVHGQTVINESAAILNYIGQLKSDKNLIPQTLKDRAYYDELCFFVLSDLEQALWTITKHQKLIPKQLQIPEIRKVAEWEFSRSVSALDNYIKDNQFSVGNNFTMADILIAHTLRWAAAYQFDMPQNLTRYMDRMFARSSYKAALQKELNKSYITKSF